MHIVLDRCGRGLHGGQSGGLAAERGLVSLPSALWRAVRVNGRGYRGSNVDAGRGRTDGRGQDRADINRWSWRGLRMEDVLIVLSAFFEKARPSEAGYCPDQADYP